MRKGLWIIAAVALLGSGVAMAQGQGQRPDDRGRPGAGPGSNRPGDQQRPGPGRPGGDRPDSGPPNKPAGATPAESSSARTPPAAWAETSVRPAATASLPERRRLASCHPRPGVPVSAGILVSGLDDGRDPAVAVPDVRVLLR